jgi:hypothetical protein
MLLTHDRHSPRGGGGERGGHPLAQKILKFEGSFGEIFKYQSGCTSTLSKLFMIDVPNIIFRRITSRLKK